MSFDARAFERKVREHAEQLVDGRRVAVQTAFDRTYAAAAGQPLTQVLPTLDDALADEGLTLSEPHRSKYATAIAEGRRTNVKVEIVN